MKILLLGPNGQLGWELQRSLAALGETLALGRAAAPGQALRGDLQDLDGLAHSVRTFQPQVIVNAAAYTAVDKAESDAATALRINAEAPAVLAREAARLGCLLLHYSTDYVFNGQGEQPWREDSPTGPLNVYGRTKLQGEQALRDSGCPHLIFRTSWVYAARGGNFAKTMLRLARERESLSVVDDQFGAPTGADLLADVSAHALRLALHQPARCGTYHLCASGVTSWHGYARHVLAQAQALGERLRAGPEQVKAVPSSAFPTPAARPHNSRMDCSRLEAAFGLRLPDWQAGVTRMLQETLNQGATP